MLQVEDTSEIRAFREVAQEAREKGRHEAQVLIARKLLAKKCPLEEIAELTGLSVPQIKKLKRPRK